MKRISSADLNWIVLEELWAAGWPEGIAIAVVPDPVDNWRIIIQRWGRAPVSKRHREQLATIERKLRALYTLKQR
jgi:hypothetical protein